MPFPALDVPYFKRNTTLPSSYIDEVETSDAGFTLSRAKRWSSRLGAQLRKRYGQSRTNGSGLPFGQSAAPLVATGTTPPAVVLSGVPTLGSLEIVVAITLGGPLATATFQWSPDGGINWTTGLVTGPAVPLAGTGLVATFPPGTYSLDNLYTASTPVPPVVLGWLTDLLAVDILQKRGSSTQVDRAPFDAAAAAALADVEKAANSKDGLFDLPLNEDGGSNIKTGGPLMYGETSPFVSADAAQCIAEQEDCAGMGSRY